MLQVLPLSVHKLVSALILVLCSAALVPEMARRRIRSADLRMLGAEDIGMLWDYSFSFFHRHTSPLDTQDSISISLFIAVSAIQKNANKQKKPNKTEQNKTKEKKIQSPTKLSLNLPLISEPWKMTTWGFSLFFWSTSRIFPGHMPASLYLYSPICESPVTLDATGLRVLLWKLHLFQVLYQLCISNNITKHQK